MSQNSVENLVSKLRQTNKSQTKSSIEICAEMLLANDYELRKIVAQAVNEGYPIVKPKNSNAYYLGSDSDREFLAKQKIAKACTELEAAQRLLQIPFKNQIGISEIYKLLKEAAK